MVMSVYESFRMLRKKGCGFDRRTDHVGRVSPFLVRNRILKLYASQDGDSREAGNRSAIQGDPSDQLLQNHPMLFSG